MRKSWISVAAMGAAMMASPVLAADGASGRGEAVGVASASGAAQAAPKKDTKYCLTLESTGSRLGRRTCRTASEWSAEGVDLAREMKKQK